MNHSLYKCEQYDGFLLSESNKTSLCNNWKVHFCILKKRTGYNRTLCIELIYHRIKYTTFNLHNKAISEFKI